MRAGPRAATWEEWMEGAAVRSQDQGRVWERVTDAGGASGEPHRGRAMARRGRHRPGPQQGEAWAGVPMPQRSGGLCECAMCVWVAALCARAASVCSPLGLDLGAVSRLSIECCSREIWSASRECIDLARKAKRVALAVGIPTEYCVLDR